MPKVIPMKTRGKIVSMVDKAIIHPFLKQKQQYRVRRNSLTKDLQSGQRTSELKQAVPVQQHKCAVPFQLLTDQSNKQEKVCEICDEWASKRRTIICCICDDIYHTDCIESNEQPNRKRMITQPVSKKLRNSKKWTCQRCAQLRKQIRETQKAEQDKEDICQKCIKVIKCNEEHPECMKCKNQYHSSCFIFHYPVPLCTKCYCSFIPTTLQQGSQISLISDNSNSNTWVTTNYQQQKIDKGLTYLLPEAIQDEKLRNECHESLKLALHCQNISFNDDLQYDTKDSAGPEKGDNNGKLEPYLQQMTQQNVKLFQQFKELSRNGIYGQVKVEYTKDQGFTVVAVGDIPVNTIICEYAGTVYFYAQTVFHESDSIMTLLQTNRAATTLVIVPDECGNLAKYLSGINNSKKSSKIKKQNVMSVRFSIDGEARVLLLACKNIKAGDTLYYDYNEGGQNSYDTNDFV